MVWRIDKRLVIGAAALFLVASVAGAVYSLNRGSAPAATATTVAETAPRPSNERMLETLGGLSAAHLYQSYLNIGLLADSVESAAYTEAQANSMLTTVSSLMDMVDRQLDKLTKGELSKDDKLEVERIRGLSQLLRAQITVLRAYWRTGDAREAKRYHEVREKAWTRLSEVLGLN
jgi:hypothetical protein